MKDIVQCWISLSYTLLNKFDEIYGYLKMCTSFRFFCSVPFQSEQPAIELVSLPVATFETLQSMEIKGDIEDSERKIASVVWATIKRKHAAVVRGQQLSNFYLESSSGCRIRRISDISVGNIVWMMHKCNPLSSQPCVLDRQRKQSTKKHQEKVDEIISMNKSGSSLYNAMAPVNGSRLEQTWACNASVSAALILIHRAIVLAKKKYTEVHPSNSAIYAAERGVIDLVRLHSCSGESCSQARVPKGKLDSILACRAFKKHFSQKSTTLNARAMSLAETSRIHVQKLVGANKRWLKVVIVLLMKAMGSTEWYFKNAAAAYTTLQFLFDTKPVSVKPETGGTKVLTRHEEEFAMFQTLLYLEQAVLII